MDPYATVSKLSQRAYDNCGRRGSGLCKNNSPTRSLTGLARIGSAATAASRQSACLRKNAGISSISTPDWRIASTVASRLRRRITAGCSRSL